MASRMLVRDDQGIWQTVRNMNSSVSWSAQRRERISRENAYAFQPIRSVRLEGDDRVVLTHTRQIYYGESVSGAYSDEPLTPEQFRAALLRTQAEAE